MRGLEVVELNLSNNHLLSIDNLNRLTHHLLNGRLAILPTETGYMLAGNALDLEAVNRVYKVKGRQISNPIHVAVSGIDMAEKLVYMDSMSRRLFYKFLPGPLTIICPKKEIVSDLLVANTGNLGVRMPDCPVTLQVVQAFGNPLTTTSLNMSGKPSRETVEETICDLNWEDELLVYLIKDPGLNKHSLPSTLVSFATTPWSILRKGPIKENDIANAIKSISYTETQDWT